MRASLVSRELIADSIELVASAHQFDALVAISGCDKTIPGTVMALARLNIPGADALRRLDQARPLARAQDVTIQQVFEAVGAFASGKITEAGAARAGGGRLARARARAAGSSRRTRWRWPSRRSASRRRAPRWCRPRTGASCRSPSRCGELVMDVLRRGQRPSDSHHQAGARERDRGGRHERRLDQRRAAPAGGRARNGRAAGDRRVRRDLRAHAAAVRPAAGRAVCGDGPV